MEENEQVTLLPLEELPSTDVPRERKPTKNCLQEMLIELMNERGLRDAEVVKATGVPWGTWAGWIANDVRVQTTDDNLFAVMKFFNVHLEYLVYGLGDGSPAFEEFEEYKPDERLIK